MDQEPFVYEFRIQLHDTDAAGVLFFGHLFRHLHDAYEAFMGSIGYPLPALISPPDAASSLSLPIIHTEADYLSPLRHGDAVGVRLTVAEVRIRSFALDYVLADSRSCICARGRTVHVLIAPDNPTTARLPEGLRQALQARAAGSPALPSGVAEPPARRPHARDIDCSDTPPRTEPSPTSSR
jgi:1,4-dihydroxy-2-naphthoyl-CoA hydrolase